jgi:hypothetical protein
MAEVVTGYQAKALGEERLDGIVAELESITDEGAREVLNADSQLLPPADRSKDN